MPTTKFIKQLSLLSKPQIKAFRRFVKSPYHNSVKRLSPLLEEVLVYYPKFEDENLAVDKLFVHLYPGTDKEHEGRVNVLFTKLLKLLDEFRIIETFKANKLLYQQVKMQSYEAAKMDKSYFKATVEYENLLEEIPKDEKHALASFLHYERVYEHSGTDKYDRDSIPFKQCLAFLNKSFLWYSLAYILRTKNRNRVLNSGEEVPILFHVLNLCNIEIENDPSLFFYKTLIDLQENEVHFEKATALFKESYSNFPISLQKDGIKILLNIGMNKLRGGEAELKYDLFGLYKIGLNQKLFLNKENRLSGNTFTNIVSTTAACGDFGWTKGFIKKNSSKIVNQEKNGAINLAWAFYYYHKAVLSKNEQNFAQVIEYLNDVELTGIYFSYRIKLLQLRTYYEYYLIKKRDAYFLFNQIIAFEQMLKRKKIKLGSKFIPFIQFAKSFRKLVRMKIEDQINIEEINRFKKEILLKEKLFSKGWLIQKIGELK